MDKIVLGEKDQVETNDLIRNVRSKRQMISIEGG